MAEVFDLANRLLTPDDRPYMVNWLSAQGGTVPARSGVYMWTERVDVRHAGRFHILFIVGDGARAFAADKATDWRRLLARPNARYTAYRNSLALVAATAAPGVEEQPPTDAIAQALSLVRHTSNAGLASRVEQHLAATNPAYHSEALAHAQPPGITERIREIARRMRADCDQCLSISDAAHMASMSERNFLRHFKLEMGVTPSEYLLCARLDLACVLLADSDLPIDKIARRAGFSCGDRLAKLFRQRLAMSPTKYRSTARSRGAGARPHIVMGRAI